ncbi:MAG: PDZ domain-containing protein, partial [Nitrospinota bacterium]|nr:PDZ domain-containing protein [Nitrospinota bacterium]
GGGARMKLRPPGRPSGGAALGRAADEDAAHGDRSGRRLGLLVTPMTDRLARRMKLNPPVGVVIASVEAGSPAQAGGLQEGDVILEINRNAIQGMKDYRRLLRQAVGLDSVLLLVRRNRNSIFVALKRS